MLTYVSSEPSWLAWLYLASGVRKQCRLISEATMTGSDKAKKLVTKSDKAFALLMYEKYINKWRKQEGNNEQSNEDERPAESMQEGKKVIWGKYTVQNSGTCKYGGWSHAGVERFNDLYNLVKEERICPQAAAMEKEFLDHCIEEANKEGGGRRSDEPTVIEGALHCTVHPLVELYSIHYY